MGRILIGRTLDESTDSVAAFVQNTLVTVAYDHVDVTTRNAAGQMTQVVFKTGGSGGAIVATVDLTYDGSGLLDTVTVT